MIKIDMEMPKDCGGCNICYYDENNDTYLCTLLNSIDSYCDVENYINANCRPVDCPLIEERR